MPEFDVAITIWGEQLVPDQITAIVGVAPTQTRRRYEERPNRFPLPERLARLGMWRLSTTGLTNSPDLADHIDIILNTIGSHLAALRQQGLVDHTRIAITVQHEAERGEQPSWEAELDTQKLSAVAGLGASLNLTVLWPSANEET